LLRHSLRFCQTLKEGQRVRQLSALSGISKIENLMVLARPLV
jgi:hypothetical protein